MTTVPTTKEIDTALKTAPTYVKEYVASKKFFDALENVRKKNKLHFDEAEKINDSVVSIFLGLRDVGEFPALLKESLEQNSHTYESLLKTINAEIFSSFRAKLQGKQQGNMSPTTTSDKKQEGPQSERNEFVEVDTLSQEKKSEGAVIEKQKPGYNNGLDPYREPIG